MNNNPLRSKNLDTEHWTIYFLPLIAVIIAFLVLTVFIIAMGGYPATIYRLLWISSFGSLRDFGEVLTSTTPIIFTGLAFALAFRAGLINAGAEGQYFIAYITAAYLGIALTGLPATLLIPIIIIISMLCAGLYGFLAGIFKVFLGVQEILTTFFLNWIGLYSIIHVINNVLSSSGEAGATPIIIESARLWQWLPGSRANSGLIIAILAALLIYFVLEKTSFGYKLKIIGFNHKTAEYTGINISLYIIIIMFISGALAGVAGAIQVMGVEFRAFEPAGLFGFGFAGIAAALLCRNNPLAIIIAAFFLGVLNRGFTLIESMTDIPQEVTIIFQGVIILFMASEYGIKNLLKNNKDISIEEGRRD